MTIEHYELIQEYPKFKNTILILNMIDANFKRLFDEYHALSMQFNTSDGDTEFVGTIAEDEANRRRRFLKHALFGMLQNSH